jgi:hypothetical protein
MDTVTTTVGSRQMMGQAVVAQCRLIVLMMSNSDLSIQAFVGRIEEAPTWTQTGIGTDNNVVRNIAGVGLGLSEAGGRTIAVWVRDSDLDIRYIEYDGGWGTETSGADTTTDTGAYRDWRTFVRGGTAYQGGISEEGGASGTNTVYHEFSVGAERSLVCALGKGYAVAHARATGTVISIPVIARGRAVAWGTAQASVLVKASAIGHGVASAQATGTLIGTITASGRGHAVAHAKAAATVISISGDHDGWGIPAGLP